jgi:hypothetical protein
MASIDSKSIIDNRIIANNGYYEDKYITDLLGRVNRESELDPVMNNPFNGWVSKCIGVLARDENGEETDPASNTAVSWCALGWIKRRCEFVNFSHVKEFAEWLQRNRGMSGITEANDKFGYSPKDFSKAWNEWCLDRDPKVIKRA